MSGIEEAALMSALVYGGLGAEGGVGAAAGAATAAGALGTAAAGTTALTAGTAMGGGALSQADILMAQAMDAGGTAVAQTGGMSEVGSQLPWSEMGPQMSQVGQQTVPSLLNAAPSSAEASLYGEIAPGQLPPSQLTDFERFMRFGKQGLTKLGSSLAKNPVGTGMLAKGLLDPPAPPKQEQLVRPPGGGAPSQQPSSVSLLGQQQPHQINPYAPTLAGVGGDDAEMQRRRKLMLQQMGYA